MSGISRWRGLAGILFLALAGDPALAAEPRVDFGTFRAFSTGEGPWVEPVDVIAADFDADGNVDVAVVNRAVSTVALLRGDGAGGLAVPAPVAGGVLPRAAAAGDFDGDGLLDLAVASVGNPGAGVETVLLLAGTGDDTVPFLPMGAFIVLDEPGAIATGDFDGDSILDLAVAGAIAPSIAIFSGDGAFGFTLAGGAPLDAPAARLAIGDANGDGFLDLLAPLPSVDAVSIVAGDGAGGVTVLPSVAVGDEPVAIAAGDLDGDGALDFATANFVGRDLSVRRGDGTGAFTPGGDVPIGRPATAVAAGDLDEDGSLDFAVGSVEDASDGHGRVSIVLGDGAGNVGLARDLGILGGPSSIALVRLDGDAHLDLVAAGSPGGKVAVRRGDGAGGLGGEPATHPTVPGLAAVEAGDFDGDGLPDLLVAGEGVLGAGRGVELRLSQGGGALGPPTLADSGHFPRALATGDFDGDGALDAIAAGSVEPNQAAGCVALLRGDGAGGLALARLVEDVTRAYAVVAADFDRDGALDVAVSKQGGSTDLLVLRGDGAGDLLVRAGLDLPNRSAALAVADFDRDGILDLASANNFVYGTIGGLEEESVSILVGDGTGDFDLSGIGQLGIDPVSLVAADFDEDGFADLAAGAAAATDVVVLLNDGAGGFLGPALRFFLGRNAALVAADFDDDGHADLAAACDGGETVGILLGDGAGGFAPVERVGVGGPSYAEGHLARTAAADFDGEGHPDLAVGVPVADLASVLLNRGPFALPACVLGNVNAGAGAGARADVLFINGRKGVGPRRELEVDRNEVFTVRMKAPPSLDPGPAGFALFVAVGRPNETTLTPLAGGHGPLAFPLERFKKTFNNTGDEAQFGAPDFPSTPAPSMPLRRERGVRKRVTVFLQGVIEDPASPSGAFGVTNGITVISK